MLDINKLVLLFSGRSGTFFMFAVFYVSTRGFFYFSDKLGILSKLKDFLGF